MNTLCLCSLPDRNVRLRVLNVASHAVDQRLQRMRPFSREASSAIAIGVDVGHSVLLQLGCMSLCPFRRAEQHGLFAVPRAVNDGPLRLPSLLAKFTQRTALLQQCDLS